MEVRITLLRDDVEIPAYQTPGAAGFDLAASDPAIIPPRQAMLINTGLIIATPPGHVLLLTARSGLFRKKGLILANGVGTIDSDYQGPTDEIKISVYNPGDRPVSIEKGDRLVQGLIIPIQQVDFVEGPADAPNRGGFGSTG